MMRDISLGKSTNKIKEEKFNAEFKLITSLFPTRRNWVRLNERERKKYTDSVTRNVEQLYKSYKIYDNANIHENLQEDWYKNLNTFINGVSDSVKNINHYTFEKPRLTGILKKEGTINEYRPITVYKLHDRIITTLTARYFIDTFDNYFHNCSFAFRSTLDRDKIFTHHESVKEILDYQVGKDNLWVAECDIQKFFDTVNHKHIKNILKEHCEKINDTIGKEIDLAAVTVFDKFLESFAFNYDVYSKNNDGKWWADNNLKPNSEFKWVEKLLENTYGETYLKERIGVPQGNALSCFVANLLLHNIDSKIISSDEQLLYVRFCDDMVVIHSNEKKCGKALEIYKSELVENYLIFHRPEKCDGYLNKQACKAFWKSKSKIPYEWNNPYTHDLAIPWLSFVGYQIKYSGEVRIRKQSITKEKKKHVKEVENILKAVEHSAGDVNSTSRLSKRQIIYSLNTRLISMSVGRVKHYNYKNKNQGLCWTNGFEVIKDINHSYISRQLRGLDSFREKQIWRLNQELKDLNKKSHKPEAPEEKRYFGSPYSYHNYIIKHI